MADTQFDGNEADDIIKQIDFDAIDLQKVSNFFTCDLLTLPALANVQRAYDVETLWEVPVESCVGLL